MLPGTFASKQRINGWFDLMAIKLNQGQGGNADQNQEKMQWTTVEQWQGTKMINNNLVGKFKSIKHRSKSLLNWTEYE